MPTSGTDLKVERVKANVTIKELAAQMGLSRQSLWVFEKSSVVEPTRAREYLAAVAAISEKSEREEAA